MNYVVRMQLRTNRTNKETHEKTFGNWDNDKFFSSLDKARAYLTEKGYEQKYSDKINPESEINDYECWLTPPVSDPVFEDLFKEKVEYEARLSVYSLD